MSTITPDLRNLLRRHGQEHVLTWWDALEPAAKQELIQQLSELNFEQLRELHEQRDRTWQLPTMDSIKPVDVARLGATEPETRQTGESALRRGEVAVVLVAGGQGTRLGFDRPKGCFAIGPVSGKSLFQIHAEKMLALGRKYGRPLPFLIMTSPATHQETIDFFREQHHFGLDEQQVSFFCQGTMPALDLATGKLLLEDRGRLALSPNGHGGVLEALSKAGLLRSLEDTGVRHLFYFQVDNPLTRVCEPVFLGHHIQKHADVSTKIVPKQTPTDRLGNLVLVKGRCSMIEYSDLPASLAQRTDAQGRLLFAAGNTAIHIFDLQFLHKVHEKALLPFHLARKKVPHLDARGQRVEPTAENALKFEKFIFDVLPLAEHWTVVETDRAVEFEPLKNATGSDSPETVQRGLSNLAADWLERAGAVVPRTKEGHAAVPLEISPLLALEAEDLQGKIAPGTRIEKARYFE